MINLIFGKSSTIPGKLMSTKPTQKNNFEIVAYLGNFVYEL